LVIPSNQTGVITLTLGNRAVATMKALITMTMMQISATMTRRPTMTRR
jgi:hypothetical protein